MAIVEMSKIKLIGLTSDREKVLSAIQKSGCIELKTTFEKVEGYSAPESGKENALTVFSRLEKSLEFVLDNIDLSKKEDFYPKNLKEENQNFFVSIDEFNEVIKREYKILKTVEEIEALKEKQIEIKSEKIKANSLLNGLSIYNNLQGAFSDYQSTKYSKVYLGVISKDGYIKLVNSLKDIELKYIQLIKDGEQCVINVICENSVSSKVDELLLENSFSPCQYTFDVSAKEKIAEINKQLSNFDIEELRIRKACCELTEKIKQIKLLSDYYSFVIEKAEDSENFAYTAKTFILEGFIPKEKQGEFEREIKEVSKALFIEFTSPDKDEYVPTLTKNSSVIRQAEFITDMYSVPNYRELDPSKLVFFFFMLFMGVIMADVGYGFLMIMVGLFLARKIKVDNGTRRLWYIVTIGGIFTIIFGVLFNSYFGATLPFYKSILPNPVEIINEGKSQDGLMLLLLGCLGLGVIQIAVGYFFNALNAFRRKDIAGGIFDGIIWVIFFVGFVFCGFNFLINYLAPETYKTMDEGLKGFFNTMTMPGIIMVVGSVLVAAVTAGRNEKGFGKFAKGFGAVYGLINLMSDILSYARLFGLMLSGMIIASTFNDLGTGLMANGGVEIVFGVLVLIVGHVFNIAMNVLGAYIHDSRLQYIEFFSKFYTGEGEKFTPLGSNLKYIYLTR